MSDEIKRSVRKSCTEPDFKNFQKWLEEVIAKIREKKDLRYLFIAGVTGKKGERAKAFGIDIGYVLQGRESADLVLYILARLAENFPNVIKHPLTETHAHVNEENCEACDIREACPALKQTQQTHGTPAKFIGETKKAPSYVA